MKSTNHMAEQQTCQEATQNNCDLKEVINGLYNNQLSQEETAEAAHNLVGLFEVLLEIHKGE